MRLPLGAIGLVMVAALPARARQDLPTCPGTIHVADAAEGATCAPG